MTEIREKIGVQKKKEVVEGGKEKLFPERIKEIIEEKRKKMQDVIARMTEIAKNKNEPAVFRQIKFLDEQDQLDKLSQEIVELDLMMRRFENITDSNLENEERERRKKIRDEYREEYRKKEEEWRKGLRSIYEKDILSEINKLEEFLHARAWGIGLEKYSEKEKKLYTIEETARKYLSLKDTIEKEIKAGKWNKEVVEALLKDLENIKGEICENYARIRKEEKKE